MTLGSVNYKPLERQSREEYQSKRRYSRWKRQPRHPSTRRSPMLPLPTLSISVWEPMNQRLEEAPAGHCAGLRPRHGHFRERRGICGCNLWRSFERRATKLDEHKLTRNPLDKGSAHITLFVKCIYDFEKRFACIIRATRCI